MALGFQLRVAARSNFLECNVTLEHKASEIDRVTYTVAEAAKALSIGRTHAYRAIHSGVIGSIKIGGKILIPRAEVDRIVNKGVKESS